MYKRITFMLVFLLVALPLAVLAQDSEAIEPYECPEGYEGQELHVYNWSTYIAENTVPDFEEACGVTVIYDIFESNEDMLARIRQGNPGYDIIFPVSYYVPVMVEEELLVPLDLELIPNLANIREEFQERSYDPGNQYTIPYLIYSLGVGYNTETFPDGITSWEQVWNHDGNVAWIDDPRSMMGVALNLLGLDPNSEDPADIEAARDYLVENGSNVVTIASDDGQDILARGDVDIAIEWSGDIFQLAADCECDTFAYAIPDEGTLFELDAVAIPVDAPNPELAMVFLNYLLHPQVAADIANYTGYATPNQAAIEAELVDPASLENPGIYPSEEVIANLFPLASVSPEAEELYGNAWDELLILLGQ
jgi:spermidine/putrescine transport system substrate-binding protein